MSESTSVGLRNVSSSALSKNITSADDTRLLAHILNVQHRTFTTATRGSHIVWRCVQRRRQHTTWLTPAAEQSSQAHSHRKRVLCMPAQKVSSECSARVPSFAQSLTRLENQCDGIRYGRWSLQADIDMCSPRTTTDRLVHDVKTSEPNASMKPRKARVDGLPFGAETRFSSRNEIKSASFWHSYK